MSARGQSGYDYLISSLLWMTLVISCDQNDKNNTTDLLQYYYYYCALAIVHNQTTGRALSHSGIKIFLMMSAIR